jgi:AraC family transcriptional regulator
MSVGTSVATAVSCDIGGRTGAAQSRLWDLVRHAVSVLDKDRSEAWRCLRDAYALLDQGASAEPPARSPMVTARTGGLATWQARRVADHIEAHLGTKLTIEGLAAMIGLSRSHFSRAFRSTLGMSPMAYVAVRRIERAKKMMTTSTESLADVALSCGFADQSHLNRQFRRVVGATPGQWRRAAERDPVTVQAPRATGIRPPQSAWAAGRVAVGARLA